MGNTKNKADYDGAVIALEGAKGDASKLSDHNRSLISTLLREASSNGNKVRALVEKFNAKK